ncbi:MAG: hypothetical protein IKP86_11195, partial [Anaerolineaceae bacterium]|nr:hypothetical protein [Anaerolineaceae bacterium]
GILGTDKYTREELPAKISQCVSGLSIASSTTQNKHTRELEHFFMAGWFALPDTLDESFDLIEDIIYHTDFSDYDYIRSLAAQNYNSSMMSLASSGPSYAIMAASANYSDIGKFNYYINAEDRINYWRKLSTYTDAEMDALVAKFDGFRDIMLNKNGVILTAMGNSENIMRSVALGYGLVSSFDDTVREPAEYLSNIPDLPLHTAIVTGGNVMFNYSMSDLEAAGYDMYDGGLDVIMNIIDDKLLYPEIRVKNSAYGSYTKFFNNYLFGFYSYRDPNISETYDVYAASADFLKNLEMSKTELDSYIIAAYGILTTPVGPLSTAIQGINDLVTGDNHYDETIKLIRDMKAFRLEDLVKYVPLLEAAGSEAAARATVGPKSAIEDNAELFDYINYELINMEPIDAEALENLSGEEENSTENEAGVEENSAENETGAEESFWDSVINVIMSEVTEENVREWLEDSSAETSEEGMGSPETEKSFEERLEDFFKAVYEEMNK